jgi:hypothetical protein
VTHGGFEQLAAIAAPAKYLRTLPAPIAPAAINHKLRQAATGTAPAVHRSGRTVDRARDHIASLRTPPSRQAGQRVLDLMASHPAWQLPLGYKDGVLGAERVPSGACLGDRDMFHFLDANRDLNAPPTTPGLACSAGSSSGTAMWGAAALTLDVFLFRCAGQTGMVL